MKRQKPRETHKVLKIEIYLRRAAMVYRLRRLPGKQEIRGSIPGCDKFEFSQFSWLEWSNKEAALRVTIIYFVVMYTYVELKFVLELK